MDKRIMTQHTGRLHGARLAVAVAGMIVVLLGAGMAPAFAQQRNKDDDPNAFVFPRLKYRTLTNVADNWDVHPYGDETLLARIKQVTNIKVSRKNWNQRVIDIKELGRAYAHPEEESRIFSLPFLFMTGEGRFELNRQEVATLREYFKRGGFLFGDDCVSNGTGRPGGGADFFYQSFIKELQKVFPDSEMKPLPYDHEIYHCFYDFKKGAPVTQGQVNPDMGLFLEDRLVAFVISGDIHCGWCGFFSNAKKEESLKMGVNIIVYALTH
jgi:hypothetical protein